MQRYLQGARIGTALGVAVLWLAGGALVHAQTLTYDWVGDGAITGYFSLDTSAFSATSIFDPIFGGSMEYQGIPESYLTAFYITGGGYTFDFSDVTDASYIWFDSMVSPPTYADGGGYAASDPGGDLVSFDGAQIQITPLGGSTLFSNGNFVETSAPEPGTFYLLLLGSLGLAAVRSSRRKNRTVT
jgi:hypothetical protein